MEAAMAVVTSELQMGCLPLQIGATRPVTQAVIPAASFAQTLFPASKASLAPARRWLDAEWGELVGTHSGSFLECSVGA
eukprot:6189343-Pleurochrysis_carterae.AAC.1